MIAEANQGPLHKKIFRDPIVFENGYIEIPTGPGLGVEFDPKVLEKHLVG
jgi:L-alanine-DL-glutamate epimerase-like enolase superfamily enzyme